MSDFPYGEPSEAVYAQCDPLIVDLVRRINADTQLGLKTVQSCEGHPWPFLELVGERQTLLEALDYMARALPEKMQLVLVNVVEHPSRPRWRMTIVPTRCDPCAVAEARAVLAAPWL